jgi:hypothetical protein
MFMAESNVGHKLCRPGDLVINTLWAWMAALGVTRDIGIVSPAYGVYRPIEGGGILPAYADLLLRTPLYAAEYQRRSTGVNSSRLRLYPEQFLRIPILIPPLADQAFMVRFLVWVNGRLDRTIRAKRRVIALLTEQKQVIIQRAVTRGFDPGVELKASMSTDISEKGLESLIVRHMTGTDGLAVTPGAVAEPPAPYGGTGYFAGSPQGLRPRPRARRGPALRLPARHAARGLQEAGDGRCQRHQGHQPPEVPHPAVGRDGQARRHRRAAQGHRPPPGRPLRSVLRHAVRRQRQGRGAARAEPLLDHPPAGLQRGRDPPRAGPGPVHQRPAHRHLRAEEQPDQADRGRRGGAVPARPRPARAAVRVRPLRGALRGGRCEVRMCTELAGKASWFLPFNKGYNDGAGNPPNPTA